MTFTQTSEPLAQDQTWDGVFNLNPTTSPFLPHPTTEYHDSANFDPNLDIFSEQPLFLPTNYLPQPNYYCEHTIPQEQPFHVPLHGNNLIDHGSSGVTKEPSFDELRKDLDKVFVSVWHLKNDYQTRIEKLDE